MTASIPRDDFHDALIVVPTVATPGTLVPSFQRLLQHLDGLRVHIVLSVNPLNEDHGKESVAACERLWGSYEPTGALAGCHLTIYEHGEPAGFGGAINLGLKAAICQIDIAKKCHQLGGPPYPVGIPGLMVIFNDDLHVSTGWLRGMMAALDADKIEIWSELADETGNRPLRSMSDYGKVGLVGPVSNLCAGIQQIDSDESARFNEIGLDAFALEWSERHRGRVITANFLSGFCTGYTFEAIEALSEYGESGEFAWLFDERYLIAGYEDNDLCARADRAGFRAVVAADTFVGHLGHQTFDAFFPDSMRGMRNRGIYYDVWRDRLQADGRKLFAVMRIKIDVPHDLSMLRRAILAASRIVDGFAILLTGNPAVAKASEELEQSKREGIVHSTDMEMMQACERNADYHKPFRKWVQTWSTAHPDHRGPEVYCFRWDGEFNERNERNEVIRIAEEKGADWLLNIDHDEVIENRVTRVHFDRLMSHPDPLVQSWDLSFLTHWDSNRLVNLSHPWGDRGSYTGGMHGFRMWKVNKTAPRRIQAGGTNGLHCGNSPDYDGTSKRVAGIRFRHLGYLRPQDRWRKEARYNIQDPNPNPLLVGGTSYGHLHHEENMVMQAYSPDNGIGLHMLVYEQETPEDVGRLLDQLYGLVDRIVLVWTGGKKGPPPAMSRMCAHFGVEWIRHPLNDDIGAARNAGLNALRSTPGIGWALFMDPDEHIQNPFFNLVALRRMAESTDAWGWMFRFINTYADGRHNESESIRMGRIEPGAIMQIRGRVHEGYGDSIKALEAAGHRNFIRTAPFLTINTGLAASPEDMDRKLRNYHRLTMLELNDNPNNPMAWVTLGLFWANEGCPITSMECLTRAVNCAGSAYLPFQEIALQYMRIAREFMEQAVLRMGAHRMREANEAIVDFLDKAAPPIQPMGLVHTGGRAPASDQEAWATLPAPPTAQGPSASQEAPGGNGEGFYAAGKDAAEASP